MDDPLLGRTIAQRYRLISRLGAGRVSTVYLARHVMIERLSAIKMIRAAIEDDPLYRDRFLREARAVNRINHPNIVEISDYGDADGQVYMVMEYVPGEPLARILQRGPIGERRAAQLGLQVASALGRAHQMNVVHRDLRPGSILVVSRRDRGDLVKITDFGVDDGEPIAATVRDHGLPSYAAPEVRYAGSIDPRADLFSLGAVLYEATTGAAPFAVDAADPGPPRRLRDLAPSATPFFEDVVMTLLAPDPEDRPRDGFEVADLLRRALEGEPFPGGGGRMSERPISSTRPSLPPTDLAPPSAPHARDPGPRLEAVALDRLGPLCLHALDQIESSARSARLSGPTWHALEEARKLCSMVEAIGELVIADSRAIEGSHAKGRAARADLGRRIDALARERSKTLGWAGTLAERTYAVQAQRASGAHPIPTIDAMIWEQAALEQEEDQVREKAGELAAEMALLQAELDGHNEQVEHELLVETAGLEGRAAALRALALEAWLLLEKTARGLGLPKGTLLADDAPATTPDAPPTIEDPVTLEAARGEPISTVRASPVEVVLGSAGTAGVPPRRGT